MDNQPTLEAERLTLRPFTLADAPAVQRLAGDRDIASTMRNIPHPYEEGMADRWISSLPPKFERGEEVAFAILRRSDQALLGTIGLRLNPEDENAELGYWIGKPYWNRGYATEAAGATVAYGFEQLELHRIHAAYFSRNPASGRVLAKIGMKHEGTLRQHIKKWGSFEDIETWGILREDLSLGPPAV